MLDYKPMYSKESDKLQKDISSLISGYNCFADITKVFNENSIVKEFFENARNEVIESGNASLSVMMKITLEEMSSTIENLREEVADLEKAVESGKQESLQAEIRALKRENKGLRERIEQAYKMLDLPPKWE